MFQANGAASLSVDAALAAHDFGGAAVCIVEEDTLFYMTCNKTSNTIYADTFITAAGGGDFSFPGPLLSLMSIRQSSRWRHEHVVDALVQANALAGTILSLCDNLCLLRRHVPARPLTTSTTVHDCTHFAATTAVVHSPP